MLYLLGGFAILCGFLLLGYLFVNADPARLAKIVKWSGIVLAVVALIAIVVSGRLAMLLMPLLALLPGLRRLRSMVSGLRGRFAGMRLEELRPPELLALLRECRADDEESARLLEAYLDRVRSNWHDEMAGEEARPPSTGSFDVTVEEAYAILGLAPGADSEAIKAAHHRLMMQLHPDHGGTDYLATKINRARDVLLHR